MKQKKINIYRFLLYLAALFLNNEIMCYGLPPLNLGATNILDGGPLRPTPGFYWLQYLSYYTTEKFLDGNGKLLGDNPSPHFDFLTTVFQMVYFTDKKLLLNGNLGFQLTLPLVLSTKVTCNSLGLKNNGAGFGALIAGTYLQWDPKKIGNNSNFVHRFEFDVAFPIGRNEEPRFNINPSTNFFYCNLSWAATFFYTPKIATSWRLNYLWSNPNKVTQIKAGDTFYMNFSTEYNIAPKFFVAVCGYYLQQLKNNTICGCEVLNSRERVLGLGPGFATRLPEDFILLGYFYGEMLARNRTQGMRAILRMIKSF